MSADKKLGKYTFLICGAGPAGLLCGIGLRRDGHRVVIIERELAAHRPVCGEYLSPQGVAALEQMGLGVVLEEFPKVWGMRLFSPGDLAVLARFPDNRCGASLNRERFQASLAILFAAAGGELHYGEALTEMQQFLNYVKITTSYANYEVDAVIGADGRSSKVAKLAGISLLAPDHQRVAIHAYLNPLAPLDRFGQMHILADGSYAGINPLGDTEVNFSIVTDAENVKSAGGPKALLNYHIIANPGLRSQFRPLSHEKVKTTFPINCAPTEIVRGRVALIGDASGFIDPLTGEGITTAIKTAARLVEHVRETPSLQAAFAAYGGARKVDYAEKESLNRGLQRLIRHPLLCDALGVLLKLSPRLRSLFIGVIGNIYTPREALRNLFFAKKPGGHENAENRERPLRLSPSPKLAEGYREPAAEDMARAGGGAGKA